MSEKDRVIFHVDVNSAFLSWSAAERLEEEPGAVDLRLIPSAVGGNRETRHGIILAKSIPAKKFDVHTGEPVAQALRKCPDLVLVPPDFRIYSRSSKALIAVLEKYAPVVEQVSIDEAYCDMTGTEKLYGDPEAMAHKIKDEIRDRLGFTVNVGISSNKLLAKMASDFEKPDKVHTLFPEEIQAKMWPLPIGDLYGVGKSSLPKMEQLHIRTIGDAARADLVRLKRFFGEKGGTYLHEAANGLDDSPVSAEHEAEKSYGNSTTLSADLTSANRGRVLAPTLLALSDSVASRMRKDARRGQTVSVQLKTAEFVTHSRQIRLEEPTDSTDEIYETSVRLFDELWNGKTPVRLIGVTVSGLDESDCRQLSFFEDEKETQRREKRRRLDAMTDRIRNEYGKKAVVRGSLLQEPGAENAGRKHKKTET